MADNSGHDTPAAPPPGSQPKAPASGPMRPAWMWPAFGACVVVILGLIALLVFSRDSAASSDAEPSDGKELSADGIGDFRTQWDNLGRSNRRVICDRYWSDGLVPTVNELLTVHAFQWNSTAYSTAEATALIEDVVTDACADHTPQTPVD